MMKALVLDFDGVISDSAPESYIVALRTYTEMCPESGLRAALAALAENGSYHPQRVRASASYREFLDLMPLGNRAEDYGVALMIMEQDTSIPDQQAYDRIRKQASPDFLTRFHERFYPIRTSFSRHDPGGWRALIGPYQPFVTILQRLAARTTLAIATAKDRRSVGMLLRDYGIADIFPEERILDKEAGVSKVAHLQHVRRTLGHEYSELTFLDDKVNHLDAVAQLGVRCALADWGYNGEREHALANKKGYCVCSMEDVERRLFT